jgi:hypothetical protein
MDALKNVLHTTTKSFQSLYNIGLINPHKYWMMAVRVFLGLLFILIILSFYLLNQIKKEEIFQTTAIQPEKKSLIREKQLETITKAFDQKAETMAELKAKPTIYSDPSF